MLEGCLKSGWRCFSLVGALGFIVGTVSGAFAAQHTLSGKVIVNSLDRPEAPDLRSRLANVTGTLAGVQR